MENELSKSKTTSLQLTQLCGFKIGNGHYAVPVLEVQEVIKPQAVTPVPLSPNYVRGLINLRGQIVTSISLRTLFGLPEIESEDYMNIIVRSGDSLYALIVDEILDVMDIEIRTFEKTPETLDDKIKRYIGGVYKQEKKILILIDLNKVLNIEN